MPKTSYIPLYDCPFCHHFTNTPTLHLIYLSQASRLQVSNDHTLACKGDEASEWKRPKFDPSQRQNPITDLHQNFQAWLRQVRHPTCKILYRSVQGFLLSKYVFFRAFAVTSFSSFSGLFNKATADTLKRFLRKIRQKTSFRVRKCLTIFDI